MSVRHVALRAVVSLAATAAVGAFSILVLSGTAGAQPPYTDGETVPGSAVPSSSYTAGTPFSSGQTINIVIPATENAAGNGPLFTASQALEFVECAAPNGVIPSSPSTACDLNTVNTNTVFANSDGSVNYYQDGNSSYYPVYSLPNAGLGEGSSGPVCGSTSATECILYVGTDVSDSTAPHVWSQPFFVAATPGNTGADPGDGTPEVPVAILLPLAAMGLIGGAVGFRKRRHSRSAASVA